MGANDDRRVGLLALGAVWGLMACGVGAESVEVPEPAQVSSPPNGAEAASRAAYIQARQQAAGSAFFAVPTANGFAAHNEPHGFALAFDTAGVALFGQPAGATQDASHERSWQARVAVSGYGCGDDLQALDAGPLRAAQNHVEHDLGVLRAWYLNGPLGLEQGFTLSAAPPCLADQATLSVAMTVAGLTPRERGGWVSLDDKAGAQALRYADLYVVDADERQLPASLRVDGADIVIDVQARDARFPVVIDPVFSQQSKMTADDGSSQDGFGDAVSLFGDTALLGARGQDQGAQAAGAAYVFVKSGGWVQQQKLTVNGAQANDQLGFAVSLGQDTALVSALENLDGTRGAVYVFQRSGSSWSQEQKLTASDADLGDLFGFAVSLAGDTALVGASGDDEKAGDAGAAYVFLHSGTTWTQQDKLIASDGATLDVFGQAVSLSGDTAVVGAVGHDDGGDSAGAAYVFVRSGTTWTEQQKLTADSPDVDDFFGRAVAIDGDVIVVGADGDDDGGDGAGAVYLFERSGSSWSQTAKLTASDTTASDQLGASVSLFGNALVAGAALADTQTAGGAAYVFADLGSGWLEQDRLTAGDAASGDRFGDAVALWNATVVVGAPDDDDDGSSSGAAYLFTAPGAGDACTDDDDCLSGICDDGLCCDRTCDGACEACNLSGTEGSCIPMPAGDSCRDAAGDCDAAELCDGVSGACPEDVASPDGTPCPDGSCQGGECTASGQGGGSSSGSSSGASASGESPEDDGGCGCHGVGHPTSGAGWALALLGLAGWRRHRRRTAP